MKTATPEITEVEGNFLLGAIDKSVRDVGVNMKPETFQMAAGDGTGDDLTITDVRIEIAS